MPSTPSTPSPPHPNSPSFLKFQDQDSISLTFRLTVVDNDISWHWWALFVYLKFRFWTVVSRVKSLQGKEHLDTNGYQTTRNRGRRGEAYFWNGPRHPCYPSDSSFPAQRGQSGDHTAPPIQYAAPLTLGKNTKLARSVPPLTTVRRPLHNKGIVIFNSQGKIFVCVCAISIHQWWCANIKRCLLNTFNERMKITKVLCYRPKTMYSKRHILDGASCLQDSKS